MDIVSIILIADAAALIIATAVLTYFFFRDILSEKR